MPNDNSLNRSNLGYLGQDYQYRLVNAFLDDHSLFKRLYRIIDQNAFTAPYLKKVVGTMKDYFDKKGSVPSYGMLEILLNEKSVDEHDKQLSQETIEKIKGADIDGLDQIKELGIRFFRQQNMIRVINEIRQIVGSGNLDKYDECQNLMESAANIGLNTEEMSSPYDSVDDDLSKESVVTIPTGISKLDACLGGGIDKGKLGLIIAGSGFGKALPVSEPVATPNGFVPMGELKVGDKVMGTDGKPHTILGYYNQGKRPIYRVFFSDGTWCRCDEEHLWNVTTPYERYNGSGNEYKTMSFSQIMKEGIISPSFKENGNPKKYSFTIPVSEPVEFEHRDIENIDTLIKEIVEQEKLIPEDIMTTDLETRKRLFKEVFKKDFDETETTDVSLYNRNQRFVSSLSDLVSTMGRVCTIDDDTITVHAKGYKKYIANYYLEGPEEAACIKVDAEDELYLTRYCIVTHNTSFTTCIAGNAAIVRDPSNDFMGFKTLQICFEDTPRDIHRKYFSKIAQVETSRLNESEATTEFVRNTLKNYEFKDLIKNNIRVMSLPSGEYSATQIKDVIKNVVNEGFRPDQVIVDYFECLAPEKGTGKDSKWDQEGKTMRKFEVMAKELNMAFWVPVQGNRESLDTDIVKMGNAGGSIQKVQIAQVILSISRSIEDTHNQRATLTVLKNRSGKAGEIFNGIKFNNGTCTITCDDVTDFDNPVVDNW